jgi:glycosyltransferase involved in cell wall biosynthesis
VSRYSASRHILDQAVCRRHPYKPMAVTANLLVRRAAYEDVGGFLEVRSGGDSDFCWRLQDCGWTLGLREEAAVVHHHRERVRSLARQSARYGASRAWLKRRHPASARPPRPLRELARCAAGVVAWTLTGRFERASFKAIDAVCVTAETAGYVAGNGPRHHPAPRPATGALDVVFVTDLFPELSQTFVAAEARALAALGHRIRVLAAGRGTHPEPTLARALETRYLEDDGDAQTLADLAWLVARRPRTALADLRDRLRWRREEWVRPLRQLAPAARRLAAEPPTHLHAHFASQAALDALRLSRFLDVPYSVTAHAYEIFQHPANLADKLNSAALVTSGCDYNVEHLRALPGVRAPARIEKVIMGVDPDAFRRSRPYPGTRRVVAIGRLVEKKGFGDLVRAAALLRERDAADAVTIIGDGPLEDELRALIEELGAGGLVTLAGAQRPAAVRDALESADLLAMPCVVAADGDRDSMPLVVKEALAMEVPVVATDEVGLPEVVRPPWGALVPPHDPEALADAIAEILARPPDERRAMGAAGRAFVSESCNVHGEALRLQRLLTT